MGYAVLGPLEVTDAGGALVPMGGPKQRALLAILLLHEGEVVSVDRLIDDLWGESPPDTAENTIQVYVSQLRKLIGGVTTESGKRLETRRPGYVLHVEPDELDVDRFLALARRGREALVRGAAARAVAILGQALAVWRGPAYADFAVEVFAQMEIDRLDEERMAVTEDRLEASLELGHAAALVAELEALVHEHPHRERLRGHMMIALYRSGRQVEALQAFESMRALLADEQGIDPGPGLRQIHEAILRQDPWLEAPSLISEADDRVISREGEVLTVTAALIRTAAPSDAQAPIVAALEAAGATVIVLPDATILGLFGTPVAGRDDASRASRTAVAAASTGAKVMLTTLRLPVTVDGLPDTTALEASGGPISELAAAAPGDIVVDRSTVPLLPQTCILEDDKGRTMLVGWREEVGTAPSPYVGRADLVRLLGVVADDLRRGLGRVLLVEGDEGIGKSRLLEEFRLLAPTVSWFTLDGSATDPVAHMVREWAQVAEGESSTKIKSKVRARAKEAQLDPGIASSLLAILDGSSLPDQESRDAIALAWIRASAERGAAVLFDDMDEAGASASRLFESLLPITDDGSLGLIATTRPDRSGDASTIWASTVAGYRHRLTEFRVEPLTTLEAEQLADVLSPTGGLDPPTRTEVVVRADGNPFFLEELMHTLLESGALESERGWTLSMTTVGSLVPPTLEPMLVGRIQRLPVEARQVVQVAAVIGDTFPAAIVQTVLGERDITDGIAGLLRSEIVREVRRTPGLECAFLHRMLRDATLATLTPARAKELHRRTAEASEAFYADQLLERAEQIGRYFYRSDTPSRGVHYLEQAAATTEARGLLDHAAELRSRASKAAAAK